ncbi:MAG TPA: Ig-like domain-containing protein [Gemmatimonadaceae bacterium]|nr:Ig-like domain-containing protein [Gemmatimonadaceae bacterium]
MRWAPTARTCVTLSAVAFTVVACGTTDPVRAAVKSTLTPSVSSVASGEAVELSFTFRDADGNLLGSAPVNLSTPLAGATFTPPTGITTEGGGFTTVFAATAPGSAPVTASVGGRTAVVLPQFFVCAPVEIAIPASAGSTLRSGQCFSDTRSNAIYRFTLDATTVVSLSVASAFPASLSVTPLTPEEHIVVDADQGEPVDWMLPVGSYQARVGATSSFGAFSLTSQAVAGNAGCAQRYLATSATITGQSLGVGDCNFGDGTKFDSYGIYSSRSCSIRLQSTAFTPYLWLYDVDTFQINGTTGMAPGNDAVFGLTGCRYANGPIFIWVNTEEGESGGDYTLVVTLTGPPAGGASDTVRIVRATTTRPTITRAAMREMRARARFQAAGSRR